MKRFGAGPGKYPRLAVIGCGAVAEERHLPALSEMEWRPWALVDPRLDRAQQLARRHEVERAVRDVSELAEGGIEAALVATTPATHARIAQPLLENGVHVLVEKPMTTSAEDARAMVGAAASHPRHVAFAVGCMRRFLFVNRWVKKLIETGMLGDIERVDVQEGERFHGRARGNPRAAAGLGQFSPAFWEKETAGGGVLMETGSHTLDTLVWWLGEARAVEYHDDSLGGVESDALVEMEFPEVGAAGTVELSRTRALRNTAVLTGSRGRIEVALHRNEIVDLAPADLVQLELDGRDGTSMPKETLWGDMFGRELRDWLDAIQSGRAPFVSGASAALGIDVIGQCYGMRRPLRPRWAGRTTRRGAVERRDGSAPKRGTVPKSVTALVTGASGFIGGRLTERLVLEEGVRVRAAVHTLQNGARISRFPTESVETRQFDMAAPDASAVPSTTEVASAVAVPSAIDDLVEGCDTVFHLAHDATSAEVTAEAARSIGMACVRAGVGRLVFASSVSVHEPLPDGPLTEADERDPRPGDAKVAAEREIARLIRDEGLRATVVRPTIVYGPFGGVWTDAAVQRLLEGDLVLPAPGDGVCNAVYVDDVVSALILASRRDGVDGGTFLVSGPDHPTWLDFYRACARALGRESAVRTAPYEELERHTLRGPPRPPPLSPKRLLAHPPLQPLRQVLHFVRDRLGEDARARAMRFYERGPFSSEDAAEWAGFPSTKRRLDIYAAKCLVQIEKARDGLGYEPEFDLDRGMSLTADYIRWAWGHRVPRIARKYCKNQPSGAAEETKKK